MSTDTTPTGMLASCPTCGNEVCSDDNPQMYRKLTRNLRTVDAHAAKQIASLLAERDALKQALELIEEVPAVPFSRDNYVMAKRTLERMQEIARAALAQGRGK